MNQYISADNLNRYTTGIYDTKDKAMPDLQRMISLGYTDAFIMDLSRFLENTGNKNDSTSAEDYYFTIQFSATRKPADKKKFGYIENIRVTKGDDGFYQYSSGLYISRFLAEKELEKIRSKGYPDAFIKKIHR